MKKLLLFAVLAFSVQFSNSLAQSNIGLFGVGAHLGYVMPEDPIDPTFGFGLNADLGTITPAIKLAALLDYWGKSYSTGGGYGSTSDVTFSVIAIGAMAKYQFEMEGNIKPYAGAGLSFNIASSKAEWSYYNPLTGQTVGESSSDSNTDLAIHLAGGAGMPLNDQLDGFAELRYTISDADYLGIWVGVNYKLK